MRLLRVLIVATGMAVIVGCASVEMPPVSRNLKPMVESTPSERKRVAEEEARQQKRSKAQASLDAMGQVISVLDLALLEQHASDLYLQAVAAAKVAGNKLQIGDYDGAKTHAQRAVKLYEDANNTALASQESEAVATEALGARRTQLSKSIDQLRKAHDRISYEGRSLLDPNALATLSTLIDKAATKLVAGSLQPASVAVIEAQSQVADMDVQLDEAAASRVQGKEEYENAIALFEQAKYGDAYFSSKMFLRQYPKSEYASGAIYHLGLCLQKFNNQNLAADSFRFLVENYPESPYLGLAQSRLGDETAAAPQFLDEVPILAEAPAALLAPASPVAAKPVRVIKRLRVGPDYKQAMALYKSSRDIGAVRQAFLQILNTPGSDMLDHAAYWVAETYYDQKNYKQALRYFKQVHENNISIADPIGYGKDDDAQLKIAYCYKKMGQAEAARAALQQLLRRYPKSEYLTLARAVLQQL